MNKRLAGEERRRTLLQLIESSNEPITGSELARHVSVSRQVIVQDLSLLKAKGHQIVATARGYVYLQGDLTPSTYSKKVACRHTAEEMEAEMNAIVDEGVTIKDVIIDHPVYGSITGQLMVKSRRDVRAFLERVKAHGASPLSQLTGGLHVHTLEADHQEAIDAAVKELDRLGILVSELD
ncbi:transcription repressor NadR [Exiguobacterium aestuarii]|uniref:Transcription repressor NadR n=1 Tax=Exiguobacterium aestuarii TaxID=273527 RepID=A0ABW2PRN2_9BACL|nr:MULTISPECIES: transcription repressor NadR [Exiguobacterium]MCT4785208.1 transcription repressor NadR [Exiguobacterium aestuarii]MDA5560268.1 transcription repressor NadR [Exiguobacterium sp. MMG028]